MATNTSKNQARKTSNLHRLFEGRHQTRDASAKDDKTNEGIWRRLKPLMFDPSDLHESPWQQEVDKFNAEEGIKKMLKAPLEYILIQKGN